MIESLWPMLPDRNPLGNFIDKIAHRLGRVPGFCNICGGLTVFNSAQNNLREYVGCSRCQSVNRQRQIAAVLLSEALHGRVSRLASIHQLPEHLTIWNAETTRALHAGLTQHFRGKYLSSEYIDPEMHSGELRDGIMHVDMQQTHFADESIDYILSGDVLEHMPDPVKALRESFRVLKAGGAHIFTVLFYHHRFTIERRAEITPDGSIRHLRQAWLHNDPVRPSEGALVFNVFAPELLGEIEKIGFEARLLLLHSPFHGIYGNNAIVIVARKTVPPDHARDWIFS